MDVRKECAISHNLIFTTDRLDEKRCRSVRLGSGMRGMWGIYVYRADGVDGPQEMERN